MPDLHHMNKGTLVLVQSLMNLDSNVFEFDTICDTGISIMSVDIISKFNVTFFFLSFFFFLLMINMLVCMYLDNSTVIRELFHEHKMPMACMWTCLREWSLSVWNYTYMFIYSIYRHLRLYFNPLQLKICFTFNLFYVRFYCCYMYRCMS